MSLKQNNIKNRIHRLKVRRIFIKGFLSKYEKELHGIVKETLLKELDFIEKELAIREYYKWKSFAVNVIEIWYLKDLP